MDAFSDKVVSRSQPNYSFPTSNQENNKQGRRALSQIDSNDLKNNKRKTSLITDYLKSCKKCNITGKCVPSLEIAKPAALAEWEIKLRDGMDQISKDKSLLYDNETAAINEVPKAAIIARIEEKLAEITETEEIKIRNRSWENCVFYKDRLILKPMGQAKLVITKYSRSAAMNKFQLIVLLLDKIKRLLLSNSTCTKRELYYQNVATINNQILVNDAIDNISCLLEVGPWELGVFSTSKGLVYGNLKVFFTSDEVTNCNVPGGTLIPQDLNKIVKVTSTAYFILVVEKDSIFQKLLDEDLPNKLTRPFIMITGKGYSDTNTRLFLKKLSMLMSIPVFVLVDADPDGIDILLTYKFGSLSQSHLSDKLAVPNLRWLGVFPSEITLLNVSKQPLNEREKQKVKDMLTRPYMESFPKLRDELQVLAEKEVKAEIEGLMKNDHFISQVYLPNKFYTRDYL